MDSPQQIIRQAFSEEYSDYSPVSHRLSIEGLVQEPLCSALRSLTPKEATLWLRLIAVLQLLLLLQPFLRRIFAIRRSNRFR